MQHIKIVRKGKNDLNSISDSKGTFLQNHQRRLPNDLSRRCYEIIHQELLSKQRRMTSHDSECAARVRHAKIGSIYYYLKENCNFSAQAITQCDHIKISSTCCEESRKMPRQKVNETSPWLVIVVVSFMGISTATLFV